MNGLEVEHHHLVETHLGCIWWTINKNRPGAKRPPDQRGRSGRR
nr:MAG TPA: hypothetical protein [Siphoviridae sp. ct5YG1]